MSRAASDAPILEISEPLVRELVRALLSQVRGRGSLGRRSEIAAQVASLLGRHEVDGFARLAIAKVVVEELRRDSSEDTGWRAEFSFTPDGEICWSPDVTARALGVTTKRLTEMRRRGEGPSYIKLGDAAQARTVYRVDVVLHWIAWRERVTAETYPGHETAA